MIFWCRAKGILTTLRRKIALLETLLKDIIAKLNLTQRLLTWPNSLFISISSIELYLFSNAKLQNTYQKNLRPLFKSLKFASEEEGNKWLESMQWLKNKFDDKDIKSEKEPDNLPKHFKKYFFNKDKSFNSGRYEYWIYS